MSQVYEVTVQGTGPNDNVFVNTFKFEVVEDAPDHPFKIASQMVEEFAGDYLTSLMSLMPANSSSNYVTCKRITGNGGNRAVKAISVGGMRGGNAQCSGVGADLALVADGDEKNRVGHCYTAAVSDEDLVDGRFDGAFEDVCVDFATQFLTQMTFVAGIANLVIFHRDTLPAPTWHTVTNIGLRPKPVLLNKRLIPVT